MEEMYGKCLAVVHKGLKVSANVLVLTGWWGQR